MTARQQFTRRTIVCVAAILLSVPAGTPATAAESDSGTLLRVLTLQDYNTRVVLSGTLLLGVTAGLVGTFTLLRRQALVGDVVSHAALPGVAVAFLAGELTAPGSGRSLGWLLMGAALSGTLAVIAISLLRRFTPIRPDAALAAVLGVFFGLGTALFKTVQELPSGNQAGLQTMILGSAATMTAGDVRLIATAAVVTLLVTLFLFKELSILCFDEQTAAAQGWPVLLLDLCLTGLVVAVTVIGLQSVGILMVALLITPPSAARFWTDRLSRMAVLAIVIGGCSAVAGCLVSATVPKLAGGPTIVLAGSLCFGVSLLFGTERGLLLKWLRQRRNTNRIGRDDLIRAMFEIVESRIAQVDEPSAKNLSAIAVQTDELLGKRHWSRQRLLGLIARAERDAMIRMDSDSGWRFTRDGARIARDTVRNHRLWELYLITHAHIPPSHVDRDADFSEHGLDPQAVEELEQLLAQKAASGVPPSPHPVESGELPVGSRE
ncbi:iron chelate uptake ABC transporter family permease subunit [bacterium]|nr:iron chelate uptake ABC transporter family permease subunit [bacterium]